ncbi:hypothetical protein PMAYCL1PPCAC_16095, partial [Pristionchus mayeri]
IPRKRLLHKDTLLTDYFEIQWLPTALYTSEIPKNKGRIYVDIQISYTNDEYHCPFGYSLLAPTAKERWCYTVVWYIPPERFTYDAAERHCNSLGDSLPILSSQEINHAPSLFAHRHLANHIWLAIQCD